MKVQISSNYEQALYYINRLDENDKEKLADVINEITSNNWLINFQKRMSQTPISNDEILSLVKEVRSEMYENSH